MIGVDKIVAGYYILLEEINHKALAVMLSPGDFKLLRPNFEQIYDGWIYDIPVLSAVKDDGRISLVVMVDFVLKRGEILYVTLHEDSPAWTMGEIFDLLSRAEVYDELARAMDDWIDELYASVPAGYA